MRQAVLTLLLVFAVSDILCQDSDPPANSCSWCGLNAECVNNTCACLPATPAGNPNFACYNPGANDICELCDDPTLTTLNGESTSLTYLDSTFFFEKYVSATGSDKCKIQAAVRNTRIRGKSYPKCIILKGIAEAQDGTLKCSYNIKVCALSGGSVSWRVNANAVTKDPKFAASKSWVKSISDPGKEVNVKLCKCPLVFKVTSGRILTVKVACCDVTIGFRPFVKDIDGVKTGIFVLTEKKTPTPLTPQEDLEEFPICLRPGINFTDVTSGLGFSSISPAMTFLALINVPPKLLKPVPERAALVVALQKCSAQELQTLFAEADFILNSAPFIREVSGTSLSFRKVLELLTFAADWFCEGNVSSCESILTAIDTNAQHLLNNPYRIPTLTKFVDRNCTSVP